MKTCPDADRLAAFFERRLPGSERRSVARHVRRCGECRALRPSFRRRRRMVAVVGIAVAALIWVCRRPSERATSLLEVAALLERLPDADATPERLLRICEGWLPPSGRAVSSPLVLRAPLRPVKPHAPVGPTLARGPTFVVDLTEPAKVEVFRVRERESSLDPVAVLAVPAGRPARVIWPKREPLDPGRYQVLLRGEGLLAATWSFEVVDDARDLQRSESTRAAELALALRLADRGFVGDAYAMILDLGLPEALRRRLLSWCDSLLDRGKCRERR